ncbi:hypothetical protein CBS101457_004658 [Exobasidium rhododendri]|nr:hypothetical protein CBS101457_004658 [Exobasidium rhododendri]
MTPSIPTVTLRGGKQVPILAFGVGTALFKQDCAKSVEQALSAGFTFLDTAQVYANSQYIAPVLSGKKSEGIVVLDKIQDMKDVYKGAHEELEKLKISKFDALLLHSPPRGKDGNPTNVEAWKIMERLKDEGVADVIGVSNWLASDLEEVLQSKPKHHIEINQIEYHPLVASSSKYKKLIQVQKRESIAVMTYASLAPITKSTDHSTSLHSALNEIAKKEEGWSPTTVLQKWASQHAKTHCDAIIASTSNKPDRLSEYLINFTSRKLTDAEVDQVTKAGGEEPQKKFYMADYFDSVAE